MGDQVFFVDERSRIINYKSGCKDSLISFLIGEAEYTVNWNRTFLSTLAGYSVFFIALFTEVFLYIMRKRKITKTVPGKFTNPLKNLNLVFSIGTLGVGIFHTLVIKFSVQILPSLLFPRYLFGIFPSSLLVSIVGFYTINHLTNFSYSLGDASLVEQRCS